MKIILSAMTCLLLTHVTSSMADNVNQSSALIQSYNIDSLSRFSKARENSYDYWGLSKEEWQRYEYLKEHSPWSVWENHSSPLAILFYYAQNNEDKIRYARLEAELDQWRQSSVVEFQSYYDRERELVFAKYEAKLAARMPTLDNINVNDRLRVFVNKGMCDTHCKSLMNRLYKTRAHLDIYVLDTKENQDIYFWAQTAGVPVDLVKIKQITLNHDNGMLKAVTLGATQTAKEIPCVFRTIDDKTNQLISF